MPHFFLIKKPIIAGNTTNKKRDCKIAKAFIFWLATTSTKLSNVKGTINTPTAFSTIVNTMAHVVLPFEIVVEIMPVAMVGGTQLIVKTPIVNPAFKGMM